MYYANDLHSTHHFRPNQASAQLQYDPNVLFDAFNSQLSRKNKTAQYVLLLLSRKFGRIDRFKNKTKSERNNLAVQSLSTVFNNALCSHSFIRSGSSFRVSHCGGLNFIFFPFFLHVRRLASAPAGLNFVSGSRIMAKKIQTEKKNTKVHGGGFSGFSTFYLIIIYVQTFRAGCDSVLMRRPLQNVERPRCTGPVLHYCHSARKSFA